MIITKTMEVSVDTKIAKNMLEIAGFHVKDKTDEEIFDLAVSMSHCYAVTHTETKVDCK